MELVNLWITLSSIINFPTLFIFVLHCPARLTRLRMLEKDADIQMSVMTTTISHDLRLLSIKHLAAAFSCHPKTVTRRIKDAGIPLVRVNRHGSAMIYEKDVRRLLASCEEAA